MSAAASDGGFFCPKKFLLYFSSVFTKRKNKLNILKIIHSHLIFYFS